MKMVYPANVFQERATLGMDANTLGALSDPIDISANTQLSFSVSVASGAVGSLGCTLQESQDSVSWMDTPSTLAGAGLVDNVMVSTKYARVKVTTAAGVACRIDVLIQGK